MDLENLVKSMSKQAEIMPTSFGWTVCYPTVFHLATPGVEQTAVDAGKITEVIGQLSQCQTDGRTISLLLLSISQDKRCRLCPERWLWSWGSCYFFSVGLEDNRKWSESMEFCEQHNASLAEIRMYQQMELFWVGLTDSLEEGQWVWQDGKPHRNHTLVEVQWNSDKRDCADVRVDGSLFAASCDEPGPWACEKPAEWDPQKPCASGGLL
ncbi:hypothetical protein AAFF_G00325440 [Aldrovandia affinis]|uniref:C-type lectin domain-containing protein n=1 Tax=Aldrovandia affinis TaxID=143900 RepID=A0AAD7X0M2_9TELE|nr:hypothetical protein AAFF_G00325440 [Aldrovandia affinis]